ncbi:hypothetical protein BST61_g2208 [Cercospora zeina]
MSRLRYVQLPKARLINGLNYTTCFQQTARSCSPIHSRWLQSSSSQRRTGEWTQDELNQLRALLAKGKTTLDAATALKRSRYAVQQVVRFDTRKKGWWTPERPEDVFKFRQNKETQITEPGKFDVDEERAHAAGQRWTESEYLKALEMRESGMSMQKIADTLGRPVWGVRHQFQRRKRDASFAAEPWTSAEDEQILALREDGHSVREIHQAMPHRTLNSVGRRVGELRSERVTRSSLLLWEDGDLALLRDLRSKGLAWKAVSARLPGRSPVACRVKHAKLKVASEV